MKQPRTPSDVVKALGGQTATGRLFTPAVSNKAVFQWCARGKFPAWTYIVLTSELQKRGIQAPISFWGIAPRNEVAA